MIAFGRHSAGSATVKQNVSDGVSAQNHKCVYQSQRKWAFYKKRNLANHFLLKWETFDGVTKCTVNK